MTFGQRLRALRQAQNLSRACCAEVIGVDWRTWDRWESSHHEPPARSVAKIADELALTDREIAWLITGQGEPQSGVHAEQSSLGAGRAASRGEGCSA